jgi:hypothetical protein
MLHVRNNKNQIYLENIETPACFFDKDTFTLMKIGEKVDVEKYFNKYRAAYLKNNAPEMAEALVLVELPKDQDILDKVFNVSRYCKNLISQN